MCMWGHVAQFLDGHLSPSLVDRAEVQCTFDHLKIRFWNMGLQKMQGLNYFKEKEIDFILLVFYNANIHVFHQLL